MVPEISSQLVSLLLQPIRAGRQGSGCAPSFEEIPFLCDSLRWRVKGVISSPAPPHPYQTNVVAQQNTLQHVPNVSLEASLKDGKNEAGLNNLQCFEWWHLYSQHDWYLDHKLCFLSEKDYKQKICLNYLLVWLYWLFLKIERENQACCLLHCNWNRCPASNSNFPSICTNVSPVVWWKIPSMHRFCVLHTGCCSSAQSMQRLCWGWQSQAHWPKPESVSWLQVSAMLQRWWLLLLKRRLPLGLSCPGSHQLRPHSWIFSTK